MRRLPVYFLIDVSESMVGQPIASVQEGMRTIIQELRTDPYALETVFVSIIAFARKAATLSPLTELYMFYPPSFPVGGGTSLGAGLNCLMDCLDRDIQKTTMEQKGDWKPIVFLFTDGNPTDDCSAAFRRWNDRYRRHCNLVAISIGTNMNTALLGQITENVLMLNRTDNESFRQFFKWVTDSIRTSSMSVSDTGSEELKLSSTSGINLEKVNPEETRRVDENFAVLLGKCQTTGRTYLIKYARRFGNVDDMEHILGRGFGLVGAYPVDENSYRKLSDGGYGIGKNINTNLLYGSPTCPCCGNQLGLVICECGGVFCAGENANDHCPWCGMHGELSAAGEGGIDVTRTQG